MTVDYDLWKINHEGMLLENSAFRGFKFLAAEGDFMQNKTVRGITLSGFFIALGLVIPMVFHAFGVGSTFLPMHIPVLIAGFVVDLPFAVAIGILTPILSSLFTGMPPVFPVLPYMIFELAAYGAIISLLYRKLRLNVYISLVCGMAAGRIVSSVAVWVLATFFTAKLPGPVMFVMGGIAQGIPGIIIQIVFIPAIILALQRSNLTGREGIGA